MIEPSILAAPEWAVTRRSRPAALGPPAVNRYVPDVVRFQRTMDEGTVPPPAARRRRAGARYPVDFPRLRPRSPWRRSSGSWGAADRAEQEAEKIYKARVAVDKAIARMSAV